MWKSNGEKMVVPRSGRGASEEYLSSGRRSFFIYIINADSQGQKEACRNDRVGVQVKRKDDAADHGKYWGVRVEGDFKAPSCFWHLRTELYQTEVNKKEGEQRPEIEE
jgi:hypothetical protein